MILVALPALLAAMKADADLTVEEAALKVAAETDPVNETEVPEPASADALVDAYAPTESWGTFHVVLPRGERIECRHPERYGDLRDFEKGLGAFWKKWQDPEGLDKAHTAELRKIAPRSFDEAYAAYLLVFYAVAPTFSDEQALRLLRGPWLVDRIKRSIVESQRFVNVAVAVGEIERAGEGSPSTVSTGGGSEPASPSSDDTPTS